MVYAPLDEDWSGNDDDDEEEPVGSTRYPHIRYLVTHGPRALTYMDLPDLQHLEVISDQSEDEFSLFDVPSSVESLTFTGGEFPCLPLYHYSGSYVLFLKLIRLDFRSVRLHRLPSGSRLAPSLKTLSVIPRIDPTQAGLMSLDLLQQKDGLCGSSVLEYLCLGEMTVDDAIPTSLIAQGSLKTLHLVHCTVTREFLLWLAKPDEQNVKALPNLSSIVLEGCDYVDNDYRLDEFVVDCAYFRPLLEVKLL